MRSWYFVGGPTDSHHAAFIRRLAQLGGPPEGWRIYPHANDDGQALHVVEADSPAPILAHLEAFAPIYEHGPIVEIRAAPGRTDSGENGGS